LALTAKWHITAGRKKIGSSNNYWGSSKESVARGLKGKCLARGAKNPVSLERGR